MTTRHDVRPSRETAALATAWLLALALASAATAACSSSSPAPATPGDAASETSIPDVGATTDALADAADAAFDATLADAPTDAADARSDADASADAADAIADTAAAPIRCTQAEFDKPFDATGGDFTAYTGVNIVFPTVAAPTQYTNHCAKVKVGTSVTFVGSFSKHPLQPSGGDTPSPIPATSTDTTTGYAGFTVTTPGTFGYQCAYHPTMMFGAIQVVP